MPIVGRVAEPSEIFNTPNASHSHAEKERLPAMTDEPAEKPRADLLRAQDVTEEDLTALRAGTISPRLRARLRVNAGKFVVLALLGLIATGFLGAVAGGLVGNADITAGLVAPLALGLTLWATLAGIRRLTARLPHPERLPPFAVGFV